MTCGDARGPGSVTRTRARPSLRRPHERVKASPGCYGLSRGPVGPARHAPDLECGWRTRTTWAHYALYTGCCPCGHAWRYWTTSRTLRHAPQVGTVVLS